MLKQFAAFFQQMHDIRIEQAAAETLTAGRFNLDVQSNLPF
jgi:hypothetical protein